MNRKTVLIAVILIGGAGALQRRVRAEEMAPSPSIEGFRKAAELVRAGDLSAAKAALAVVAEMKQAPSHHRQEAAERIREIERIQAGRPAQEPRSDKTTRPALAEPGTILHVAPSGNDGNAGTQAGPFATLNRARDEIRALAQRGPLPAGGVAVEIHAGTYRVGETFRLEGRDSGTTDRPIVYRAAKGERPVFTGGLLLTGFQPVTDPAVRERLPEEARSKVRQLDLKSAGLSRLEPLVLGGFASGRGFKTHPTVELFCDGKALPLARWPNEGFVPVVDVSVQDGHVVHGRVGSKVGRFRYEGDRPQRWKDDPDILLYGYWFWGWADSYELVEAIDTAAREIALKPPYHHYGYRKGQPFIALNLLSEIDRPGEWYIDRRSGLLYLYPPDGAGDAAITLSAAPFPFVELDGVSHVTFQGLTWEFGGSDGLLVKGGAHCLLAGCTVRHFVGNGVSIAGGTGHGLLSCDIHSMGRGGVVLSGGDRKTLVPGRHFVENCHIHDLSRIDHTYTPAVAVDGVGHRIAHNLLQDVRSSAIRLNGNDHLVEYNEVCRVVWESDDQGGADMWGDPTYRGNVYRYNYWHHIGHWEKPDQEPECGQAGIRLDDAISGVLIYGNIFRHCATGRVGFGGVQIHGGKENFLDNNIFVDCRTAISFSPWKAERWAKYIEKRLEDPAIDKSLYLQRYPELAALAEDPDVNTVSRNLVFRCGEFLRRDKGQNRLMANLVTTEDLGSVDAADGKFRLDPRSPALATIGFRPLPFDQIGLYRDGFRSDLPSADIR